MHIVKGTETWQQPPQSAGSLIYLQYVFKFWRGLCCKISKCRNPYINVHVLMNLVHLCILSQDNSTLVCHLVMCGGWAEELIVWNWDRELSRRNKCWTLVIDGIETENLSTYLLRLHLLLGWEWWQSKRSKVSAPGIPTTIASESIYGK